jgi:hypothetical protein
MGKEANAEADYIHLPNLNAGTVINEMCGGTFKSINSEAKLTSKKRDHNEVRMHNL